MQILSIVWKIKILRVSQSRKKLHKTSWIHSCKQKLYIANTSVSCASYTAILIMMKENITHSFFFFPAESILQPVEIHEPV